MKILFKQGGSADNSLLLNQGISNTYVKKLSFKSDSFLVAKKEHHHTCFEIHFIMNGHQTYEISGKSFKVDAGNFLIIPPGIKHKLSDFSNQTEKFSVTFITDNTKISKKITECTYHSSPERIIENLKFIETEHYRKLQFSKILINNVVFETVIELLRIIGFSEKAALNTISENARLSLAKQFIKDNIELTPTVTDIAEYCNMSTKQLTRLFKKEDITPLAYIQRQKIKVIQKLLSEDSMTLKEIAEKFNFNNEYYFNSYFKKYAGMPPGEYRDMHIQK